MAATHSGVAVTVAERSAQAEREADPRSAAFVRLASTISVGAQNGSSGIPITSLVRVTCSALNGFPWAA